MRPSSPSRRPLAARRSTRPHRVRESGLRVRDDSADAGLSVGAAYMPQPVSDSMAAGFLVVTNKGAAGTGSPRSPAMSRTTSPCTRTVGQTDARRSSASTSRPTASSSSRRGGNHLMFEQLKRRPREGEKVAVELHFAKSDADHRRDAGEADDVQPEDRSTETRGRDHRDPDHRPARAAPGAAAPRGRRRAARPVLAGAAPASAHAALTGSDPAAGCGGRQGPDPGDADLLREGRHVRRLDPGARPEGQARRHRQGDRAERHDRTASSCTPGCPTARSPSPTRSSPPTATPSPAPSPSPSAPPPSPPSRSPTRRPAAVSSASSTASAGTSRTPASSCSSAAPPSSSPAGSAAPAYGPLQRLVVSGWLTLTAATLALLLLRGPYTGSGKLGDVFDLGLLGTSSRPRRAPRWSPGCCCSPPPRCSSRSSSGRTPGAGRSHRGRRRRRRGAGRRSAQRDLTFGLAIGGAVIAIGLAATWALAEHASTGIQPGIAMPVDVLHLLAVAAWLGGLVGAAGRAVPGARGRPDRGLGRTPLLARRVRQRARRWSRPGSTSPGARSAPGRR